MDDIMAQLEAQAQALAAQQQQQQQTDMQQDQELERLAQAQAMQEHQQQQLQQQQQQQQLLQQWGDHSAQQHQYLAPPFMNGQDGMQQEQQQQQQQQLQFGGGPLPPPPTLGKRHRWGKPMGGVEEAGAGGENAGGENAAGAERKRKRRTRWEEPEKPSNAIVVAAPAGSLIGSFTYPKEVSICGGAIKVTLPSHLAGDSHSDPKIRALSQQLKDIDHKIAHNELDIPPEGQRSPSPEPVYDRMGVRLNTREIRYKEKMLDTRHRVIEELIKEDPGFKPPADYRPRKFSRRLRIPQEDFPNYNFIGLLIGPRGNTQKRMQAETNTKIAIRGRGSVKEGIHKDGKYDYGEDEELHVLITGNTQQDVDAAYAMVDMLLKPDDDSLNEHKRMQLRELAALNGTLKDEILAQLSNTDDQQQLYVLPEHIKAKVEEQYAKDVARMHGAGAESGDQDYKSFLKELGGSAPSELMGELVAAKRATALGASLKASGRELPDDCKLYVGSLPPTFTDEQLRAMFEPFTKVAFATVIMDQLTGQSRGFGFVHFEDAETAKLAATAMHGKPLEGKPLVVRLRSEATEKPKAPGGANPYHANENTLYVTALNPGVTEPMLRSLFENYGKVTNIRLIVDRETGRSKGYGFVTMSTAEEVTAAIHGANGYKMDNRGIVVKKAGEKGSGGPPSHPPPARPLMTAVPPPPGIYAPPPAPPGAFPPPGAPPPYPGAPPPYYPPPGFPPPYIPPPGSLPPPVMPYGAPPPPFPGAPPPAYPAAPPPYPGMPPPAYPYPYAAYAPPPAYPFAPPPPAPAPPPTSAYDPAAAAAAAAAAAPPPPPQPPLPAAQPPLPDGGAAPPPVPPPSMPPLPGGPPPPAAPPPLPTEAPPQSDYDRFMQEMAKTFS